MLSDIYELLTFEPLHNHNLSTSKIGKKAVEVYLSPDTMLTSLKHTPNN